MAKILICCPYDGLAGLKKSLEKFSKRNDFIFSDRDIVAIDDNAIYVGEKAEKHDLKSFSNAFIRYPYDLIEPHTRNYTKREDTEFLKTLALLFSDIGLNNIKSAHFARNRFFSLNKAKECGLKIPRSFLLRKNDVDIALPDELISKSLGNCYFSELLPQNTDSYIRKILSREDDAGDTAYIYSPHIILSKSEIQKHIESFGSCFLQSKIEGEEYRVFIVEKEIFTYRRKAVESLDKSSAGLIFTETRLLNKYKGRFQKLRKKLNLTYLCLDVIFEKDLFVIDINPFGSFPAYNKYPRVTDALSKLLLS